jgi:hypothetical protein
MPLDDRRLSDLRTRLLAADDPAAADAVAALALALQTLGELAGDDSLPRRVRRKAAKTWAVIRWGSDVPNPLTPRDEFPVWGSIFDEA